FSPVRKSELDSLVYSVDVLTEPELTDEDGLDVKRYGVIVEAEDGRRGLLLPDLAGIDTVEEQISIAAQKGNIRPDEKVRYWRFEVVRHR
ncbi:MAG: AMMECR1 domain-containing protein, partial [Schwartzia sp.]|nr:AMMECR1 domain-containing protein [Schwartzia sp. (in: firmicutes)]